MKMVRKDNQGRKAGELGYLLICPHCGETLTRNKHWDELALAMAIVFLPAFIVWVGIAVNSMVVMFSAILISLIACFYSLFHYRYKLKDWPRWIKFSEYIKRDS